MAFPGQQTQQTQQTQQSMAPAQPQSHGYDHTITTITSRATPDPFVTYSPPHQKYYMTWTAGNRVEIWCSSSLPGFRDQSTCSHHVVWTAPPGTPHSGDIWAPELHALNGRWWVYFAADNPAIGNASHRLFVLGGPPATSDPCAGGPQAWQFLGPLRGLPNGHGSEGQWAIDATVITLQGQMYVVYSGWPWNFDKNWWVHRNDSIQQLWIAHLADPMTVDSRPVMICAPSERWEFSGDHGINEGPQWLCSPDGAWAGLVYSCAGSWTNEYKMATLRFLGGEPLDPRSWRKSKHPLIKSARGRPPYGPGHGNFVHLGNEVVGVFHATDRPDDGWKGRKARCQKIVWGQDGEPFMGETVGQFAGEGGASRPGGRHEDPPGTPKKGLGGLMSKVKGMMHQEL